MLFPTCKRAAEISVLLTINSSRKPAPPAKGPSANYQLHKGATSSLCPSLPAQQHSQANRTWQGTWANYISLCKHPGGWGGAGAPQQTHAATVCKVPAANIKGSSLLATAIETPDQTSSLFSPRLGGFVCVQRSALCNDCPPLPQGPMAIRAASLL